jgi:hypothetical protein
MEPYIRGVSKASYEQDGGECVDIMWPFGVTVENLASLCHGENQATEHERNFGLNAHPYWFGFGLDACSYEPCMGESIIYDSLR